MRKLKSMSQQRWQHNQMLEYGKLKPMEPRSAKLPFDSDDYLYQVKWDGVRIIAFIEEGQVRLQNRRLHPRTQVYPDFISLDRQIKARKVILDGEMIVLENGKPSFSRILQRDLKTDPASIKFATQRIPATYIAFDLLSVDGKDMTQKPLTDRLELLQQITLPNDHFQIIENFTSGVALFEVIQAQEMEGIVAKSKTSTYLLGQKSEYWQKIKTSKDLIAVVGGYTLKEHRLSSLLMGAYLDNSLYYIGNAATGLTSEDIKVLSTYLQELAVSKPSFVNPPRLTGVLTRWVMPLLTVKVEFMEWSREYQMRAPVIKGFTKDIPEECTIR